MLANGFYILVEQHRQSSPQGVQLHPADIKPSAFFVLIVRMCGCEKPDAH
jgi:hypothetical protein